MMFELNGKKCFTGLLLEPGGLKRTLTSYTAANEHVFTLEEIIDIVRDKNRTPMWERCPMDFWHREQITNSCNGYSLAGAEGRQHYLDGRPATVLSGPFAYCQMSRDRDQGSTLRDGREVVKQIGIAPDGMVDRSAYRKRDCPPESFQAALSFQAHRTVGVPTKLELYSALARQKQSVVAVHVNASYNRVSSDGRAGRSHGAGNHSVLASDLRWNDKRQELEIYQPQSWYRDWGVDGACFLTWEDHLAQTTKNHEFFMLLSSEDDEKGDNPPELKH